MGRFFLAALIVSVATLAVGYGQDKKGDDKKSPPEKKEKPRMAFVKIHDDGRGKDSAGLTIEVEGLKVEFLKSGTLGLELKPSVTQKTKDGGTIYSFNGYKIALKQSAAVLETVTMVRGPRPGTITVTVPKGKLKE